MPPLEFRAGLLVFEPFPFPLVGRLPSTAGRTRKYTLIRVQYSYIEGHAYSVSGALLFPLFHTRRSKPPLFMADRSRFVTGEYSLESRRIDPINTWFIISLVLGRFHLG